MPAGSAARLIGSGEKGERAELSTFTVNFTAWTELLAERPELSTGR
jgi:hypothetical protein